MKHIWSILCKKSVIDRETNNVSIFDVLEEIVIFPPSKEVLEKIDKPVKIPMELELVSLWVVSKEDAKRELDMAIEKYDPDNKKISVFKKKLSAPKDKQRIRTIIKMMDFGFTKPGNYIFHVKAKNGKKYKLVAEIPLKIKLKFPSKIR